LTVVYTLILLWLSRKSFSVFLSVITEKKYQAISRRLIEWSARLAQLGFVAFMNLDVYGGQDLPPEASEDRLGIAYFCGLSGLSDPRSATVTAETSTKTLGAPFHILLMYL